MAAANLDLVRSIYAAWERGDWSSTEWADPAIELVTVGGLEPGHWRGVAGMARAWREFMSAWDDLRAEAAQYHEIDGERVLVIVNNRGRGKVSGLEIGEMDEGGANLFHVDDGKVTRIVVYSDREQALADLGLTPETDAADSP
jgi:ketosteroid isomerase-like protein